MTEAVTPPQELQMHTQQKRGAVDVPATGITDSFTKSYTIERAAATLSATIGDDVNRRDVTAATVRSARWNRADHTVAAVASLRVTASLIPTSSAVISSSESPTPHPPRF